jgi:hypothetical protein
MKKKTSRKLLTKAELHLRASRFLGLPLSCILNVVPNFGKDKYFIHRVSFSTRGKAIYATELVYAKDLEK